MSNMKVAEARARFGELLDAAEAGRPVVVERRGVRFRIVAEAGRPAAAARGSSFDFVDPAVTNGQWTWRADAARGMQFAPRKRR